MFRDVDRASSVAEADELKVASSVTVGGVEIGCDVLDGTHLDRPQ